MHDRIEKSVELNAPIERVWRALTDHEQFGAWFLVKIADPFVVGQKSDGQMTYPGYEHLPWQAVIVAMDAPNYFAFRWPPYAVDPAKDYSRELMTLVEFRLEETATGTRLNTCESGFDSLPADRRDEAYRMNEGGWEEQMGNVKRYVEA